VLRPEALHFANLVDDKEVHVAFRPVQFPMHDGLEAGKTDVVSADAEMAAEVHMG